MSAEKHTAMIQLAAAAVIDHARGKTPIYTEELRQALDAYGDELQQDIDDKQETLNRIETMLTEARTS